MGLRERFEKETGRKEERCMDVYELYDLEARYSAWLESRMESIVKALRAVAETEQSHVYITDPDGMSDIFNLRYDLRKCGDIAREALTAYKGAIDGHT